MPSADRLRRPLAVAAVALGAALFGGSVGDMARMDRELRAAAPAARTQFVVDRQATPARQACGDRDRPAVRSTHRSPEV